MSSIFSSVKLKDVAKIYSGNSINEKVKEEKYTGLEIGISYISTKDISFSSVINYDNGVLIPTEEVENFKIAPPNTVFICAEGGSAGRKIAISDRELCFVNKLFAIVAGNNAVPKYIYYAIKSDDFIKQFKKSMTGIIGGVSLNKFKELEIMLPPLHIQKKIVERLDAIFLEADKATLSFEINLKNAEELLISFISQSFDELKANYELIKLGDVCSRVEYGSSSKSENIGKVPVLRMGNILNGKLDFSDLVFTNDDEEISKYQLSYGDVLFNRTNSPLHVGKTAVFQSYEKVIFAGYLIRIQYDKNKVFPEFLAYYLNSKEIREHGYSVMSHSINQANINGSKLKEYPFILPPLDLQKAIVNSIIEIESHCLNLVENYSKKKNEIFLLKNSILKQAFNGELIKE